MPPIESPLINFGRERVWAANRTVRDAARTVKEEIQHQFFAEPFDIELVNRVYPDLIHELGQVGCEELIARFRLYPPEAKAIDLGAGSDPLRSLAFLDVKEVEAVDPAYIWYESNGFDEAMPYGVFGGRGQKSLLTQNLRRACKELIIPRYFERERFTIIRGVRRNVLRSFTFIPQDASSWIVDQPESSIPNLVVWRAFPQSEVWAEAIEKMKEGGILITSGYGNIEGASDYARVACGVDIDNSALPRNGNTRAIGLMPLTGHPNMYFYQKIEHMPAADIAVALRANV